MALMVKYIVAIFVISWFYYPTVCSFSRDSLTYWRAVLTSEQKVVGPSLTSMTQTPPSGVNKNFYCSNACNRLEWCNLWCNSSSNTDCIFSNIIIMPDYLEVTSDAISCYSRRPKDFATGAKITAGVQLSDFPARIKENMVDGFYNFDLDHCFISEATGSDMWLRLDLGEVKSFRHVRMIPQWNIHAATNFYSVGVRVGMFPQQGLEEYLDFGFFPGQAKPSQEVLFEVPEAVRARYVLVQKFVDIGYFQVCHIEVY